MLCSISARACQLHTPARLCLAPNRQQLSAGPLRRSTAAPASSGGWRAGRQLCVPVQARRSDRQDFDRDYVHFDDEEDWEQSGTTIQPGVGPILSTTLRGLSAITDRLTGVALQLAPADASPAVVRVAVSAGLVLLALSFVKSLLSFSLTLGTIILGAYVAVKVFGLDVAGVSGGRGRTRTRQQQQGKRRPDPRGRQSEFKGLLGSGSKEDEDGLLDVWFERKAGSSSSGSKKAGGGKPRRR